MNDIVAVILAGGRGKRLHMTTPKPLVQVAGKRCIDYIIEHLQRAKVKDIILALYFKPTEFQEYWSKKGIGFSQIQSVDYGTAGALLSMEDWLSDPFIVWNGDTISNIDLQAMLNHHRTTNSKATVFTHQDLIHSGGIYIFNKEILSYIPHDISYSIHEDLIPDLINKGVPITAFKTKDYYYDIGSKDKLTWANEKLTSLSDL